MALHVKTSKNGDEWRECRRAVVPVGVDLKTYTALCEMACVAMGDDDTFWMGVFLHDVPGLHKYHKAKPRLNEESGSAGKVT